MMAKSEAREYLLSETNKAIDRVKESIIKYPHEKTLKLTLKSLYSRRWKLENE